MPASFQFPEGMRPDGIWHYWRPSGSGIVELGIVHGQDVALPPHFHDEDQLTFVLSGRRRFLIDGRPVEAGPGEGVRIPAGTPHRSLSELADVVCINIYVLPGACMAAGLFSGLSRLWQRQGRIGWPELVAAVEESRSGSALPPAPVETAGCGTACWETDCCETVGQAARLAGMSREGFSRRFHRLHGMSPQLFRISGKLNEARHLLRLGQPLAAVAADTGFADQSHLGRCFRRAFGVTPGLYRRSMAQAP